MKRNSDIFPAEEKLLAFSSDRMGIQRSNTIKLTNSILEYESERSSKVVEKSSIDMSIIDRIKAMRSKSRENGEVLNKRREDTIK